MYSESGARGCIVCGPHETQKPVCMYVYKIECVSVWSFSKPVGSDGVIKQHLVM